MSDEKTDQVSEEQSVVEEKKTVKDYLGLSAKEGVEAWKKDKENKPEEKPKEEKVSEEKKEVEPTGKEEPVKLTKTVEEDCPDCPGGKKKVEKEPYKIIKVDGKEIPVWSKKEFLEELDKFYTDDKVVDPHQMARDYTQKNQKVAEREKEVLTKSDEVNKIAKDVTQIMKTLESGENLSILSDTEKGKLKKPEEIKKVIAEKLGVDLDFAEEGAVKMVEYMADTEAKNQKVEKENVEMGNMIKLVLIEKAVDGLGEVIKETRKEYPFEEIFEGDTNRTGEQFVAILKNKANNNPTNKSIPELTKETVMEVSMMQRKTRESAPNVPEEKINEKWLKENRPELYEKLTKEGEKKTEEDYRTNDSESPPSLEKRKVSVDTKKEDKEIYATTKDAVKAWRRDKQASA